MERRLAAVLAADVVGYSRLMSADEQGTLARLNALLRQRIRPLVAARKGRIVKLMGDGLLADFGSVVEAVLCAIDIQAALADWEPELPEERRIRLRIGVNLGDIIVKGADIYGDGVNVAARLEALAAPGGVCVSGTVYEHVKGKVAAAFADRGEQQVKNIDRPVHVYALVLGDGDAEASAPEEAPAAAAPTDKPSIAVLPFTNMGGDAEQDYFADGMVEDILTGLARIKWLFVVARNSSFVYKGKAVDVRQVGRELGVRYVLEGSVRKAANRVRVTGQLIEAATDRHVWADRYDRTLEDIFDLQDELTMSVVAVLEPSLRQAEVERVKRKRPESLDAYDLVLRALPHVYPAMPEAARKAVPLLERALELEPGYALAHGFAAWAHEIIFARGGQEEAQREAALRHAQAALAHGRDDAMALVLGGFVLRLMGHDREAPPKALEAALAISPSCAMAYILGSVVMLFNGEAEKAIDWGERALSLSPLDPMSYAAYFAIALGRLAVGDPAAAAEAAQKAVQANPYWSSAYFALAAAQAVLDRQEKAEAAARRVLELEPGFTVSRMCAAFDIPDSVADPLRAALVKAGLPA